MRHFVTLVCALLIGFLLPPAIASAAPVPAPATASARWCTDYTSGWATVDLMGHSVMAGGWATELNGLMNESGRQVQIWTGAAIGGSRVSDYLPGGAYYNHTQFTANNPSLIIAGWDLNEYATQVPPATFKSQYQQFINEIRRLSPTSSIMLVHSPWNILPSMPIPQWGYADAINQLAQENGVLLLRMESAFSTSDPYHQYSDGIHHTALGLHVDATLFNFTLRSLCRQG